MLYVLIWSVSVLLGERNDYTWATQPRLASIGTPVADYIPKEVGYGRKQLTFYCNVNESERLIAILSVTYTTLKILIIMAQQ